MDHSANESVKKETARCRNEADEARQALLEFVHAATHDLKAPLRHVASYCTLLKEEAGNILDAERLSYVDRMSLAARRMQRLLDDLAAYASILAVAEKPKEKASLDQAFQEAVAELAPAIEASGARISSEPLPDVSGYPVLLTRIFYHLIDNALKYRGGGAPVISIRCVDEGDHYLLSFRDNGTGIDKKHLEKIFSPFVRLHAQDEIEGTGLGLSACRRIVEMHDGRIWAVSEPGAGSVFNVILPHGQTGFQTGV